MKKKKTLLAVLLALLAVVCFAPYELRKREDGCFSYKALFLGVFRTLNEENEHETILTFFNPPPVREWIAGVKSTLLKKSAK